MASLLVYNQAFSGYELNVKERLLLQALHALTKRKKENNSIHNVMQVYHAINHTLSSSTTHEQEKDYAADPAPSLLALTSLIKALASSTSTPS